MMPGLPVEKCIISSQDLAQHVEDPKYYSPEQMVQELVNDGFEAMIKHPKCPESEKIEDLICFGSNEVRIQFVYMLMRVFLTKLHIRSRE